MRKLLIATLLGALSASASAADATIFSCTAKDGQQILVKKTATNYELTYDSLSVKTPIKQVLKNENSVISYGSGFTTSTLELGKKAESYVVGFVQPRDNPENYIEPTLSFYKNGALGDKTIYCDMNKSFEEHFEVKIMRKFPS